MAERENEKSTHKSAENKWRSDNSIPKSLINFGETEGFSIILAVGSQRREPPTLLTEESKHMSIEEVAPGFSLRRVDMRKEKGVEVIG